MNQNRFVCIAILIVSFAALLSGSSSLSNPSVRTHGPNGPVSPRPASYNPESRVPSVIPVPAVPAFPSNDFLFDDSVAYQPAAGDQQIPAVAYGAGVFLVVWQDWRYGRWIFGARYRPDGTLLDSTGFPIANIASGDYSPSVAFGGSNFLAVWEDYRTGHEQVRGTRIGPDGTVLDPQSIVISPPYAGQPAVAFDGANYLVTYSWGSIRGTRVTLAGAVLDSSGILIGDTSTYHARSYPAAASNGGGSLVVWEAQDSTGTFHIRGARVDQNGNVLDRPPLTITRVAGGQLQPRIAFTGANYLVTYMNNGGAGGNYGTVVSPTGGVSDTLGFHILSGFVPVPAFGDTNCLVAFETGSSGNYDVFATRVTPSGAVLDSPPISVAQGGGDQSTPVVAAGGGYFFVVWSDNRNGQYDVYAARVNQQGVVQEPNGFPLSLAAYSENGPSAAYGNSLYLVAWQDSRDVFTTGYKIYAARVRPDGTILDPHGFVVCPHPGHQFGPNRIAFDGTNFLVVWEDHRNGNADIYGARISPDGTVLDPNGIAISTAGSTGQAAVAFEDSNYIVVWGDARNMYPYRDIYACRVSRAGVALDPSGIGVCTATDDQSYPAVVFDGVHTVVTWMDYRSHNEYDIYAARMKDDTVLDPDGFLVARGTYNEYPAVAGGDWRDLILWRTYERNLYAVRLDTSGAILDTMPLLMALSQTVDGASAAFDGAQFMEAWDDGAGLHRAHADTAGRKLDSIAFEPPPDLVGAPAIACQGSYHDLMVWNRFTPTIHGRPAGAARTWGLFEPPTGGIEETPNGEVRATTRMPSIARGVLFLRPSAASRKPSAILLDISGRKVLDLKPGPNDVSSLAPGVYFVRDAQVPARLVRKLVITK